MLRWLGFVALVSVLLSACGDDYSSTQKTTPSSTRPAAETAHATSPPTAINVRSEAFAHGDPIPERFTCEGDNVSPALSWSALPEATRSLVLVMDDPDAPGGTFTHWVVYDLPPTATSLPEGIGVRESPSVGGTLGTNDYPRSGYSGPCPPTGESHRYVFRIYALDRVLGIAPGLPARHLPAAIEGHVLAQGELTGTFGR
jgi:Raf kinase inhibitor-like YbhB/YbcL family protein